MDRIDTLVRAGTLNSAVLQDLFSEGVTKPNTTPPKGIENGALGFMAFWNAYPSGTRKVARQQCLDKWTKLGCAANFEHILAHIAFMKTTKDWQKDEGSYVPMPATYLNQQRWSEWERPQTRPAGPTALDKIKEHMAAYKPPSEQRRAELAALSAKLKGGL